MSLSDNFIDGVVGVIHVFRPAGYVVLTGWTGLAWSDPRRGVGGGVARVRGGESHSLVLPGVELTRLSHV